MFEKITKTVLLMSLIAHLSIGQNSGKYGFFDEVIDIGDPALPGLFNYNVENQEYTMTGAGENMWGKTDQFNFLYKKIKGDFTINATVKFMGAGVNPHRKIGIMARNSLLGSSAYADACVHGDILTSLQYRSTESAETEQVILLSYHPVNIELQRVGNVFTFSAATFGENYKSVSKELALNEEVFAGLFICSHEANVSETAIFSNVRITIPPPEGWRPYRDYIGSNLEIMDVKTGVRKILHNAPNSLQAPNWSKDGKFLLYNSEGKMYKYDIAAGQISQLNTGDKIQNNNDHVISMDGKQLAISHHVGAKRTSTIFTLPINGSDNPRQITSPDSGHSYLHGWSPDAKKLIFTGQRKNQYDIWTVDLATKKETALTNTAILDDGPEYSPDGKYVYFNSVLTGTMKIWRMRADGSQKEQVTFDEYNDWFPHFSPDGKQILYISFPKDIEPTQHPFYKKVMLRIMPSSGGIPKTIAFLFGGQGTINTPSWSPDSKYVAFISNSK
ncbi:MAG: biopolymer transporter TolR [Bacteroidota bacterium]